MKVIVVYSGGLDSTVLLYHLIERGNRVKAITFDYGQRHRKEIDSARNFCDRLSIEQKIIDLSSINSILSTSALTTNQLTIPEGAYTEESLKITVVPNRNMILLSIATAWAINERFDAVAYGAHKGDHIVYPDCRESFVSTLCSAIELADWHRVTLLRPFIEMKKEEICRLGTSLNVPFELSWSCYLGGEKHCGKCSTCTERRNSFKSAGLMDPTMYSE